MPLICAFNYAKLGTEHSTNEVKFVIENAAKPILAQVQEMQTVSFIIQTSGPKTSRLQIAQLPKIKTTKNF